MNDGILSNKYFVIALIIALVVVIYLYVQKRSCKFEGMRNIDLSSEMIERPWAEDDDIHGRYKSVNRRNYRNSYRKKILDKDELYEKYSEKYDDNDKKVRKSRLPKPMDDRPDLSQCQCVCKRRKKYIDNDDDE